MSDGSRHGSKGPEGHVPPILDPQNGSCDPYKLLGNFVVGQSQ